MMSNFYGTGIAIITPFNEDLTVDHNALGNIVEYNISNGVDYIVISGTTGESVTTSRAEKKEIIQTVKRVNNSRVPLVMGIGGNNTSSIIDEIKNTNLDGIDAILSVSPYYSKPTQDGIYCHFEAISKESPLPLIIYNVPGRTSSNILPETTLKLGRDFENIIGVKEAGNNVAQYLKLLKDKPEDFLVISGDDDLALGVVLAGGAGVISVLGQAVPKEFCRMIKLGLEGKAKEAYDIHFKLMDLTSLIFKENNPAGIKAVLSKLGYCDNRLRLPLVPASDDLISKIIQALDELGY